MPDGNVTSGSIKSESREDAEEKLISSDMKITTLKESVTGNIINFFTTGEKISKKQLFVFSSQLYLCLNSGLPLVNCLSLIKSESKIRTVKKMLSSVEEGITEGKTFAQALQGSAVTVPKPYIAAISAGEKSGALPATVKAMSEYYEQESKASSKLFTALVYPVMLLLLCLVILFGTWKIVIPTIHEICIQNGVELPPMAGNYIAAADFIKRNFVFLIFGLILVILSVIAMLRNRKIHFAISKAMLGIPFLGSVIKSQNTAKFSEISKTLLNVGIPLSDALSSAGEIITNYAMRENIKQSREEILAGKGFLTALERERIFPDIFIGMMSAGEASDTLNHSLTSAAEYYKSEAATEIKRFSAVAEPAMIVIVGIIVAFVMVSVYTMLMEMYGSF